MWGLPFLERVTEWRECAADGKRLSLWRERSPVYEGRGPGKRMPPDRPKVPLCCTLLESIFRNVTRYASEWGRCFCCDGGISPYALELVPFIRGELQLSAWCQVC